MKIAIIGTRGIPNNYGGFEQLAEKLSVGLQEAGHAMTVYNGHEHPYQLKEYKGVTIVHCHDPENKLGTAGQFIYDWNCIKDARTKNFDVLLFLGYTSSSVWGNWYPKNSIVISNMDGLEWKRSKYSKPVQWFLRYAEKLAVKKSHYLVADSPAIKNYLQTKYGVDATYIAYGADLIKGTDEQFLAEFKVNAGNFFLLIARMESENNIAIILRGFSNSKSSRKMLVIGNTGNRFGKQMKSVYSGDSRIIFAGAIYDSSKLHSLKIHSSLYFHGHSVGGTNPSLLEAMASSCTIAAHDNEFNRAVLKTEAHYFNSAEQVQEIIESEHIPEKEVKWKENNLAKIKNQYNWPLIIAQYDAYIRKCYEEGKKK